MKKQLLFIGITSFSLMGQAQTTTTSTSLEKEFAVSVEQAISFEITKPLSDFSPDPDELVEGKVYIVNNKLRRYRHDNPNALPKGDDPVWHVNGNRIITVRQYKTGKVSILLQCLLIPVGLQDQIITFK
jgi:hypothetical protein